MKKFIIILALIVISTAPAHAHAFRSVRFADFAGGTAAGIKGALNFDSNYNGAIYGDINFLMLTLGLELGYVNGEDRFNGKHTNYDYTYINPYFGIHLPIPSYDTSFDIYANAGAVFLGNSDMSNSNYSMPSHGTSVEVGVRAIFSDTPIILGAGFKGHYFSRQTEDNGGHYRPDSKMLFLNLGYYWGL